MFEFLKKLEAQAKENPILALGVGAGAVTAIAKLIEAVGYARNSKTRSKKG